MIISEKRWTNVRSIRTILKVNFQKSLTVGINAPSILDCRGSVCSKLQNMFFASKLSFNDDAIFGVEVCFVVSL